MRLRELTLRGVSTAFKSSTVVIPFDSIPGGLVALVGENGSGKTTLLEASGPLTLYRRSPSYDEPFMARVVPGVRDAFSTLVFALNGQTYRATVMADPLAGGGRGKSEATLAVGDRVIAGPLVREYDAAVAKLLPSEDVLLASAFASQGGQGSFFTMGRQERRDVLAVLLGLGRLQTCAEMAQERGQAAALALAAVDEAVRRAEAAAALQRALAQEVEELRQKATASAAASDGQQAKFNAAVEAVRTAGEAVAALEAQYAAPVVFTDHEQAIEIAIAAAQAANELAVTKHGEAQRAAMAHAEAVRREAEFTIQHRKLLDERDALDGGRFPGNIATLDAEADQLAERIAAATVALGEGEVELRHAHEANAEWSAERARRRRDSETAALLDAIPGVPACEGCVLTADARAAQQRIAGPQAPEPAVEATRLRVEQLRAERTAAQVAEAEWQAKRIQAARWQAITTELEVVGPKLAEAHEMIGLSRLTLAASETAHTGAATQASAAKAALDAAKARRDAAVTIARQGIRTDLEAARVALTERERDRAVAGDLRDMMVRQAAQAAYAHGAAEGKLEVATADAAGLPEQQAEQARLREAVGDWALTQRVLGRDGAQALAIDAAGPGISGLANSLLSACYGDRFQLRFVTTEPKRSGDGWKEVMEVVIYDAEQGRAAKRGSGGEMVILDEALRLAIALYNVQHAGYPCETLWRDETAGALSPSHAERYIALLRKARELGGFHHVVFIAHQREVWQQAETQVHVGDGRVTVV